MVILLLIIRNRFDSVQCKCRLGYIVSVRSETVRSVLYGIGRSSFRFVELFDDKGRRKKKKKKCVLEIHH